jgi:hypothetical protein
METPTVDKFVYATREDAIVAAVKFGDEALVTGTMTHENGKVVHVVTHDAGGYAHCVTTLFNLKNSAYIRLIRRCVEEHDRHCLQVYTKEDQVPGRVLPP